MGRRKAVPQRRPAAHDEASEGEPELPAQLPDESDDWFDKARLDACIPLAAPGELWPVAEFVIAGDPAGAAAATQLHLATDRPASTARPYWNTDLTHSVTWSGGGFKLAQQPGHTWALVALLKGGQLLASVACLAPGHAAAAPAASLPYRHLPGSGDAADSMDVSAAEPIGLQLQQHEEQQLALRPALHVGASAAAAAPWLLGAASTPQDAGGSQQQGSLWCLSIGIPRASLAAGSTRGPEAAGSSDLRLVGASAGRSRSPRPRARALARLPGQRCTLTRAR
jgi:hypothetical protein